MSCVDFNLMLCIDKIQFKDITIKPFVFLLINVT